MLRYRLIHPDLLQVLAAAGHGSKVLVADALYPHSTGANPAAKRIQLNVREGLVAACDIVELIDQATFIEEAAFMQTAEGADSEAVGDYRRLLGHRDIPWTGIERFAFYEAAMSPSVAAVVVSGETRPYANLLLTIGVP
ncbi:RbsD/FucU family protein [Aestuariimicrobium ganziense]|uniref:RbsD/FucU family protein n=1 Tax=Aestuariimicrobium ganziense TaxID=2773677 RepID=UPI001942C0D5|nr:RbsD/FucU family protein [Aestuariimicrobium ganziense]